MAGRPGSAVHLLLVPAGSICHLLFHRKRRGDDSGFRYSAGNGAITRKIELDGATQVANQTFPGTPNWSTWITLTLNETLASGTHTLTVIFDTPSGSAGYLNLDNRNYTASGYQHAGHRSGQVANQPHHGDNVARRPGPALHLLLVQAGSIRHLLFHCWRGGDRVGAALQRRQRGDHTQDRAGWRDRG